MVQALAWVSANLGSGHGSATASLCAHGHITLPEILAH